jgi:hypothetical protein
MHKMSDPIERRAPIDDERHLLFDCQATAGVGQRYVGLQATNLRDLMQHPDIGRVSWFVHECLTFVGNSLHG